MLDYSNSKDLKMVLLTLLSSLLNKKYMKDGIIMNIQPIIWSIDTIDSMEQKLQLALLVKLISEDMKQ